MSFNPRRAECREDRRGQDAERIPSKLNDSFIQ